VHVAQRPPARLVWQWPFELAPCRQQPLEPPPRQSRGLSETTTALRQQLRERLTVPRPSAAPRKRGGWVESWEGCTEASMVERIAGARGRAARSARRLAVATKLGVCLWVAGWPFGAHALVLSHSYFCRTKRPTELYANVYNMIDGPAFMLRCSAASVRHGARRAREEKHSRIALHSTPCGRQTRRHRI
jgi:hypothetical protein